MTEIKPGDTIVSNRTKYIVSDAKGFNLKDYEDEANYILIDKITGSMQGYGSTVEELLDGYVITSVLQNPLSPARVSCTINKISSAQVVQGRDGVNRLEDGTPVAYCWLENNTI
jgi:hypothetical protein